MFVALAAVVPAVRASVLVQLALVEAALLAVWLLLRAGHSKAASAVAVVAAWCVIAGAALVTGGVGPIHYVTFTVILVLAGLLLGTGGAVLVATLTIGFGQFAPVIATVAPPAPALVRIAFAYLFIIIFLALAQREMRDAVLQSVSADSLLRATLESTADGILVVNDSGTVAGYNQKFLELWSIPPDVAATRDNARLIASVLGQLRDPDGFTAKIRQVNEAPDAVSSDVLEFLDGRVFERYSQPRKVEGVTVGRVWSFRDVSERRRAEKTRRGLEEELFQAQKMDSLGRLAGGIAHDFNNILTAIVSYTELAQQDAADRPEVSESLSEVLRAAHRASDLVRQILAFSRTRAVERVPVSVPRIVHEALQLLQSSLPRRVDVAFDPGDEDLRVWGDPTQIHQVIMNLGLNAGQSMRAGGGTLTVRLGRTSVRPGEPPPAPGLAPGGYVAISISDTGIGMDVQTQARIFEPFFSTKPPGEGSGLGLSVVHSIVRNHEGGITAESELGLGSTFTVFLQTAGETAGTGVSSGVN